MSCNWRDQLSKIGRIIQHKERLERLAQDRPNYTPAERRQTVVSGDISRDPIDRTAAIVVSPAPWWAKPPSVPLVEQKQQHKPRNKIMSQERVSIPTESESVPGVGEIVMFGKYQVKGIKGPHGELLFREEDMHTIMIQMAKEALAEIDPILPRAKDARAAVNELLEGLGHDVTNFKEQCKAFLEDIRQTRFAVVGETSQMSKPLREIRQFFLDHDYKEEIARLKEFVELCERLQALKANGTLDAVGDTIIRLSVN
jgi:hypothetical protein